MKKAVSIILATVLLMLAVTATANAEIVNKEPMKFVAEAIAEAEAAAGEEIATNRIFFKMPQQDSWYSDYGVYQGKYYAGIYWWSEPAAPVEYPGYRACIDDYEQGVYYADVPDGVAQVIWNNGFYASKELSPQKFDELCQTWDINIEGAWEGDYDTIPEGSPDPDSFDGCIFVINPDPVVVSVYTPHMPYAFDPYIYYGNGCYGSYATTSENFVSIEENCLNPDHFDEQGNHIGGAHIKAPEAPANPPADTALNGYYFVNSSQPDDIRSENKLYSSDVVGEYYRSRVIDSSSRFRIVHYIDGKAISDCERFPAQGWYNENGEFNNYPSGMDYTVWFRPDGSGDSSFIDGYIKVVENEVPPTELNWETPTEPPATPTEPKPGRLYQARFEQEYVSPDDSLMYYRELYYHHDKSGETDWALVRCELNMVGPAYYQTVIGNRVIFHDHYAYPFSSGYAVYDVKQDAFFGVYGSLDAQYEGFTKAFDENVKEGRLLGDLDNDNEISVIDATIIQRCEAQMRDYPEDDAYQSVEDYGQTVRYYSDFDRDGERTILDATKIQRYLVSLG